MIEKLLLTGAAGGVGTAIRPILKTMAESVLLSDIEPLSDLAAHETFQQCDLADAAAVSDLVKGVDGILHLGGISLEKPFDLILQGNIIGAYNMFEAARNNGRPRIIFASSNHVIGYYRRDQKLDNTVLQKPDTLYGVSKAFGENLASLYADKFGQECLSVRIGSCFPKPANTRMLSTWLAVEDFADLCAKAFSAPGTIGHSIVYGVSDNEKIWWDNKNVGFLGWHPKHSADKWRAEVVAAGGEEAADDPEVMYQGGGFVTLPHPG